MEYNIEALDPLPDAVVAKVRAEIDRISRGEPLSAGWKKVRRQRNLVRFEITLKYRMVVDSCRIRDGPYICMKHSTFDHKY